MSINTQSPVMFGGKFLLQGTPDEIQAAWQKLAGSRDGVSWQDASGQAQTRPMPLMMWGHQAWGVDTVTGDTFGHGQIVDGKNPATGHPAKELLVQEVWTAADAERHQKGDGVNEKLPKMLERMAQNAAQALIDFIAQHEPEAVDPFPNGKASDQGSRFSELVKDSIFWNREADTVRFSVQNGLGMRMPGNYSADERETVEASELPKLLEEGRFDLENGTVKPESPAAEAAAEAPADDKASGKKDS